MEVSCFNLTRQEKNHQSWRMNQMQPQRDNCRMTHPSVSDQGKRPQVWVWKCCSQVLCFLFFFFFNTDSPVEWVDCLQPLLNISEYGRERQVTLGIFFSIHRHCRLSPGKGEMEPLASGGEGRDRMGFKLSEIKITLFNLPRPAGVLREVSAQPGIWWESFDVDKSALNSLV